MRVLAIGNSFSEDATRYLSQIAKAQGVDFEVVNLMIGGCSLERHYRNMLDDKDAYGLQFNGQRTGFDLSMREALLSREWDVVTIQQVSHLSFRKETFYPYITALVGYIRQCQPHAKVMFQETWSYEDGSDRLTKTAGYETSKAMLSDIQKTYAAVAEEENLDGIIPSGTLFSMMLDRGIRQVHRDTFHATLGLGRYALGLLWFRMLTGKSVADNGFSDLDVPASDEEIRIVKEIVDSFAPLIKE
ncbi:MAG: DUF4886 domain-containing protein [Clostridia bacterium]|nr:DUF4886 domain-containing protein [Clostridia bacterium]MDY6184400.1 DUF4886 domain-containing protein [Eubacteriales bacterium]